MTEELDVLQHRIPLDRVSVVIDSIYAFAMTLLVLTIDVPTKYEHLKEIAPVHTILLGVFPDLIHYFIAFFILAVLWYFEHQRFRNLQFLDRPLLCMNILSLAFVCLIPFSTNVAGDYPLDPLGATLFEFNILLVSLIACLQWVYIQRKRKDFVPDMTSSQISREITWSIVFPALSLIGIVLSAFLPYSLSIYILVPIIMAYLFWRDPTPALIPQ